MSGPSFPVLLAALAGLLLCPDRACAHEIRLFAHADGATIYGEARTPDDAPVRGATVTAEDPAGKELDRTTTNDQGKFSVTARIRCDYRLVLNTGDGHGAAYTVSAAELPTSLPPWQGDPGYAQGVSHGPDSTAHDHSGEAAADHSHETAGEHEDLETIHAQIVELRRQLDRYEEKTRFRDVVGGIGYIVGLAGIAFYFLARRRTPAKPTA